MLTLPQDRGFESPGHPSPGVGVTDEEVEPSLSRVAIDGKTTDITAI